MKNRTGRVKSRSSIASNVAWTGLGNGICLVVGFASSILLARWLGPEARGVYALILATSATLAAFLGNNAWVQALAFLTGKGRYSPPQVAGHSLIIVLLGAAAMAVLLVVLPGNVLGSFFPELRQIHLWIVVLLTVSTLLFATLTGLLVGLDQIPLLTTLATVKAIADLLLQITLLGILNLGLNGAMWGLVITASLTLGMTLAVFIWKTGVDPRVQASFIREAVTYGGKSYPGHLGVVLQSRVDIYFVALFGGLGAAGFYAVAKGLTEIVAIIEQSISQAVMPRVIAGDFTAAGAIVALAFRLSWWANILVLLVGAVLARWLIPLVYGVEYMAAVPAFLLLLPGVLLLTTRTLGTFFSMQIGRPEIPSYYILASGLISLPISYLLTRQFGYLGAAAAFSLVAIIRGITAMILFVVFSGISPKEFLISKADLLRLSQLMPRRLKAHLPWNP